MSNETPVDEPAGVSQFEPVMASENVAEVPRLRRSRERRIIAGVAGGISERFDVNENLVRVLFVVLALFWGLGVALYLILWVVIPAATVDATSTNRPEPTPLSTSRRLTIALGVAVVALVVLIIAIVRPFRVLGPSVALAWIIFLAALALIAIKTPARRVTLRRLVGVTILAFLSLVILLVGGFMGFLVSTGVSLSGGNGDHFWQPTSLAQTKHDYPIEFGVSTLDLSAVTFPRSGYLLRVSAAAGLVRVVLPANAVVSLITNVGVGTVSRSPVYFVNINTQPYISRPAGMSLARSATAPHVTVDAKVGVGQIDVMRAAP